MMRPASRLLVRIPKATSPFAHASSRRFVSTAPPHQKSRSWKNAAARWGLAAGVIYYYNTNDLFGQETAYVPAAVELEDNEPLPTIEQMAAQRRQRLAETKAPATAEVLQVASDTEGTADSGAAPTGVEALEEEAGQQGAFNPETGEINWDCPCLGGMAHGPCGEEFKAAFSCFVFSTDEPKGMDCIDKFKGMQDCFRTYPEIYGAELEDDDEDDVSADQENPLPSPDIAVDAPAAASELSPEAPISQPAAEESKSRTSTEPDVSSQQEPSSVTGITVPKVES